MLSSATCSATSINVSGTIEFRVPVDQTAPIPPVHTATFRHRSLFTKPDWIAESDIPKRRREAAAREPRDIIGKPIVCNVPSSYVLYST